mmetsp:Transcript_28876/g.57594  ORF Transcript_28876/g.57594 Transcript_28876/m.57594 type:complete len:142 (-) Transcript_28876:302-727(-)
MITSAPKLLNHLIAALLPLVLILLLTTRQALSTATRQKNPSRPRKYSSAESHYLHNTKPTLSILPIKHLNLQPGSRAAGTDRSSPESDSHMNSKNSAFDRLNRNKKYGGSIHRDSVHDAVVYMTSQSPSYDIVVMGVSSWE